MSNWSYQLGRGAWPHIDKLVSLLAYSNDKILMVCYRIYEKNVDDLLIKS